MHCPNSFHRFRINLDIVQGSRSRFLNGYGKNGIIMATYQKTRNDRGNSTKVSGNQNISTPNKFEETARRIQKEKNNLSNWYRKHYISLGDINKTNTCNKIISAMGE
jgi:hypothetical protein